MLEGVRGNNRSKIRRYATPKAERRQGDRQGCCSGLGDGKRAGILRDGCSNMSFLLRKHEKSKSGLQQRLFVPHIRGGLGFKKARRATRTRTIVRTTIYEYEQEGSRASWPCGTGLHAPYESSVATLQEEALVRCQNSQMAGSIPPTHEFSPIAATALKDGLPCLITQNLFPTAMEFSGGPVSQAAGGFRALRRTPGFAEASTLNTTMGVLFALQSDSATQPLSPRYSGLPKSVGIQARLMQAPP